MPRSVIDEQFDPSETTEVRIARVEERVASLEDWRGVLSQDIQETKQMIGDLSERNDASLGSIDQKLDDAIDRTRRSVPAWVQWVLTVVAMLISAVVAYALRG